MVTGKLGLGIRYIYCDEAAPVGDIRLNGVYLTATDYFGSRSYAGFYAEAGLGVDLFAGSAPTITTVRRTAYVGLADLGWVYRPSQQGFNIGASVGAQYVSAVNLWPFSSSLKGLLPLVTVLLGYTF